MNKLKSKDILKKYELKLNIKKIILLIISAMIVLVIKDPISRYCTLKKYDKFAKEYNIEYEIVRCPRCEVKVPNTMQFCYKCNRILFSNDEETVKFYDDLDEKINKNLESTIKARKRNKVVFYIIIIAIVYIVFKYTLKFFQELYI